MPKAKLAADKADGDQGEMGRYELIKRSFQLSDMVEGRAKKGLEEYFSLYPALLVAIRPLW
jgi:hypothetical protein